MPTLIDSEGRPVTVQDPQEAVRRFAAGELRFQGAAPLVLAGPNGQYREVRPADMSPEDFSAYVTGQRAGWRLASDQESAQARQRAEYGDRPASAFALGALRGASFGASDALISALDTVPGQHRYAEAAKAIKELNPVASGAGAVAGAIAPMLATGGASAAATAAEGAQGVGALARAAAAVAPTSLVARAGSAVEHGLAARFGEGALARLVSGAAGSAVEGAAYGAGDLLSEASLGGDEELTGQQVLAHIGLSALLGGLTSAAIRGVEGGVRAAGRGIARAGRRVGRLAVEGAETAAQRIEGGAVTRAVSERLAPEDVAAIGRQVTGGAPLRDGVADLYASAASKVSGADREAIGELAARTSAGRRARAVIMDADGVISQNTREGREILDELESFNRRVSDEAIGSFKVSNILPAAREGGDVARAARSADNALAWIGGQTDEMIADAAAWGERASVNRMSQLAASARDRIRTLAESGDADATGKIFLELDALKRQVGKAARPGRMITGAQDASSLARIREWYETLRTQLEDQRNYGRAAVIQRDVNQAWSSFLSGAQLYRQRFLTRVGQDAFNPVFTHDPGKLSSFLGKLGRAENDVNVEALTNYVRRQRALSETIAEHMDLSPDASRALTQGREASGRFERWFSAADRDVATINQFHALREAEQVHGSLLGTGALATGAGFVLGGPIGAAIGGGLSLVGSALGSPSRTIRTLAAIERMRNQLDTRMSRSVASALVRGHTTAARVTFDDQARERGREIIRKITHAAVPTLHDAYEAIVEHVLDVASHPAALTEHLGDVAAPIQEDAPKTSAALQTTASSAVAYMLSQIPPASLSRDPLTGRRQGIAPSDAEQRQFVQTAVAILEPTTVLDHLASGTLEPGTVDAVRAVYPRFHARLIQHVADQVASHDGDITYDQRLAFSTLLGVPTHYSLRPEFIASMQALGQQQNQQQASPQPPRSAAFRPKALGDLPSYATETDRIASRTGGR